MADDGFDGSDKTMVLKPSVKKQLPPKSVLVAIDPAVLAGGPGVEVLLDGRAIKIGRGSENEVALSIEGVSRNHARLFPGDGKWGVEDLGSTNGVYVNKTKISGEVWLKPGDIVSIGKVHYKLQLVEEKKAAAPPPGIDLSNTDETMVMSAVPKPQGATADATATGSGAATQTSGTQTATGRPRATSTATARKETSGNALLILMVVGVVLIVGVVAMLVL